jgi:hypothetical protein
MILVLFLREDCRKAWFLPIISRGLMSNFRSSNSANHLKTRFAIASRRNQSGVNRIHPRSTFYLKSGQWSPNSLVCLVGTEKPWQNQSPKRQNMGLSWVYQYFARIHGKSIDRVLELILSLWAQLLAILGYRGAIGHRPRRFSWARHVWCGSKPERGCLKRYHWTWWFRQSPIGRPRYPDFLFFWTPWYLYTPHFQLCYLDRSLWHNLLGQVR